MARFSYPALLLNAAGVTLTEVAGALTVSTQLVSMQLRGERRPHPSLIAVIRALAGGEVADEVAVALGEVTHVR